MEPTFSSQYSSTKEKAGDGSRGGDSGQEKPLRRDPSLLQNIKVSCGKLLGTVTGPCVVAGRLNKVTWQHSFRQKHQDAKSE